MVAYDNIANVANLWVNAVFLFAARAYARAVLGVTHPFEKRQLRQISAYNVSIVTASKEIQLRRIGNRPRALNEL